MKRKLLVDGYNLIYQIPGLKARLEMDLEGARKQLLQYLATYGADKGVALVVVFDGDGRVVDEPIDARGVKVVFSRAPEKADLLIKRFVEEKGKGEDLMVVSSDNEIGRYARLYGVPVVLSQVFAQELLASPAREAEKKFDYTMNREELTEWIRLFGAADKPLDGES